MTIKDTVYKNTVVINSPLVDIFTKCLLLIKTG